MSSTMKLRLASRLIVVLLAVILGIIIAVHQSAAAGSPHAAGSGATSHTVGAAPQACVTTGNAATTGRLSCRNP